MADEKSLKDVTVWTGHREMSLEDVATIQPGLGRLMPDIGTRTWKLYYAAKARNWPLAKFQAKEIRGLMELGAFTRPKYEDNLNQFLAGGPNAFDEVPLSGNNDTDVISIIDVEVIKRKNQLAFFTESAYFPDAFRNGRGSSTPAPSRQPRAVTSSSTASTSSMPTNDISRSICVNSSWRSARWSSSRKQRAIWK